MFIEGVWFKDFIWFCEFIEEEIEFVGLRITEKMNVKGMKMMKKPLVMMMNDVVGDDDEWCWC